MGYPTFSHITNPIHRAWNQASVFFNMIGDRSLAEAKRYLLCLPVEHRREVKDMYGRIQRDGYDVTRAAINRQLQQGEES
jgi:hypothetical protein